MEKSISQAVISRLPRYYRYLSVLQDEQVERISSHELSKRMHVTASQIRQDLNNFGGFGQQGYGYNVNYLHEEIGKILGLGKPHNIIIVGAGNIAHALVSNLELNRLGFRFVAVFDNDPNKIGTKICGLSVMNISDITAFLKTHDIEIGTICVPKSYAHDVAEILYSNGIRAFWNFANTDLNVSGDVTFENVHLADSLMKLSYNYNRSQEENS